MNLFYPIFLIIIIGLTLRTRKSLTNLGLEIVWIYDISYRYVQSLQMAKKVQRSAYTNQMGSFTQYIALGFMLNVSDPFNYSARWLLSSRLILDDPRRTYALTLLLVQMHWRNKYFHICICMDVSHYHVLAKGK